MGTEVERAHIEAEKVKFADLSEARKLVEQAALILQRDLTLVEDEARAEIAKLSRREGKSMKEVASAVLLYEELRRNANRSS